MIILDIDMDFFLDRIARDMPETDRRLPNKTYKPWSKEAAALFFKDCGIFTKSPGVAIKDHIEAFKIMREMPKPLNIVHIDAHSDLGEGDPGWKYLMGEYLHHPLKGDYRITPKEGYRYMNSGNYLAFAIANRWVKSLTYVHHPLGGSDLLRYHFKGYDTGSGKIQLKICDPEKINRCSTTILSDTNFGVMAKEPEVDFMKISGLNFRMSVPIGYIILCQSPGFTPKASDKLMEFIMKEYIR